MARRTHMEGGRVGERARELFTRFLLRLNHKTHTHTFQGAIKYSLSRPGDSMGAKRVVKNSTKGHGK
jgi:hypothetical protein